jgi:hypothetical protein
MDREDGSSDSSANIAGASATVVVLAARKPAPRAPANAPGTDPREELPGDLGAYERRAEPDDYRHRMLVNAAGFVVAAGLIAAGVWLASAMADLRRKQDCVLMGRTSCLPAEALVAPPGVTSPIR